jgi:hypothetical protein
VSLLAVVTAPSLSVWETVRPHLSCQLAIRPVSVDLSRLTVAVAKPVDHALRHSLHE